MKTMIQAILANALEELGGSATIEELTEYLAGDVGNTVLLGSFGTPDKRKWCLVTVAYEVGRQSNKGFLTYSKVPLVTERVFTVSLRKPRRPKHTTATT